MTLLSRKADYALLILSFLYQRKEGGTAHVIADQFDLSRPFVANILKELCAKGFLTSRRGVKGGYSLARDVATISLAELLETELVTISHHLKVMKYAQLVSVRREGRFMYYNLHPDLRVSGPRAARTVDLGCCRIEVPEKSRS